MKPDTICCIYCGDVCAEWDHLRPLIQNKEPTSYITEIQNLVPACGKCNQSKGNKPWREWMFGSAKLSPASRQISKLADRETRLLEFEEWRPATRICFEELVGKDKWNEYWSLLEKTHDALRRAEASATTIREIVKDRVKHL